MKIYSKEYIAISEFDAEEAGNVFYSLHTAIAQKNWDLLNLEECKAQAVGVLEAIALKIRFDKLCDQSNGKLKYGIGGFDLDGHKFETLDAVEKALKNKAFL